MSPGERAAELFRHALRGSLLSICLLVFIEWIFVATKPSFLSPLSWIDRFAVLFVAPLPFAVLAVGVLGLAFAIASLVDRTAARPLGVVFPALPRWSPPPS